MKNLLKSDSNLKIKEVPMPSPNLLTPIEITKHIQNHVREHYSFFIPPTLIDNLLVEMQVIGKSIGGSFNIHLYGTGGEYFIKPFHIINESQKIEFDNNNEIESFIHPVAINKIGFSINRKDISIAIQVFAVENEGGFMS